MPKYTSWAQVAGYFDGDGTIYFSDTSNQPYKLSVSLIFVDQSYDQIENVRNFLNLRGVRTSNILKTSSRTANIVATSEFASVKRALKRMLPYLCKKAIEAAATLDYYEGRTNGNQLLAVFDAEVKAGRREKHSRKVVLNVPYTRPEGDWIMKRVRNDRLRDALGRYRATLTAKDFQAIRTEYFDRGKRVCELVKEYPKYSRESIRRILGKGRRYILVKGIGRVDTTDITIRSARRARRGVEQL